MNKEVEKILNLNICGLHEYQKEIIGDFPKTLFKFYSLGYNDADDYKKLKGLEDNKIWLSKFDKLNDPFELCSLTLNEEDYLAKLNNQSNLSNEDKEVRIDCHNAISDRIKGMIEVASFSINDETNAPMWAYYANNHKGFCVKYEVINTDDKTKIDIREVVYKKTFDRCTNIDLDGIDFFLKENPKDSFETFEKEKYYEILKYLANVKYSKWQHENEYRVFHVNYREDEKEFGEAISCKELNLKPLAIYAGINCSKKEILKEIAKHNNLKYYEMKVSDNMFNLKTNKQSLNNIIYHKRVELEVNSNPYVLDRVKDNKKVVALTRKNADFIESIVKLDSNYKLEDEENNKNGPQYWFKKMLEENVGEDEYKEYLKQAIITINKTNKTHLQSTKDGCDGMFNIISKYCKDVDSLKNAIMIDLATSNDRNNLFYELVQSLDNHKGGKSNNISFASKFIFYARKYLMNDVNFSKYDNVVSNNLPLYESIYIKDGKKVPKSKYKNDSTKRKGFDDKGKQESTYETYINFADSINGILKKLKDEYFIVITKEEFDHIIWYTQK